VLRTATSSSSKWSVMGNDREIDSAGVPTTASAV
jgi:hypothetical protein